MSAIGHIRRMGEKGDERIMTEWRIGCFLETPERWMIDPQPANNANKLIYCIRGGIIG
jgi:hypothetical protein